MGWECPRCHRCYAPTQTACVYCGNWFQYPYPYYQPQIWWGNQTPYFYNTTASTALNKSVTITHG